MPARQQPATCHQHSLSASCLSHHVKTACSMSPACASTCCLPLACASCLPPVVGTCWRPATICRHMPVAWGLSTVYISGLLPDTGMCQQPAIYHRHSQHPANCRRHSLVASHLPTHASSLAPMAGMPAPFHLSQAVAGTCWGPARTCHHRPVVWCLSAVHADGLPPIAGTPWHPEAWH